MNMVMKPARFAILVLIFGLKVDAHAEEWGCYDPKPGHPTVEEKVLFAERASVEAIAAERKYGVPAAALAAMSVVESGYGFTRIALDANNLFGFKSNSVTGPNGKPAYVLACQPAWDENNKYISFAARGDAFDYVASRLLKSKYYSKATERYQSEINSGREKSEATHDWIAAIASSYNHAPDKYVLTIENVIARYFQHLIGRSDGAQVAFSEQESPSSLAKIARASAGQYLNSIQKNGHTVIYNARGMHENCKNPDLSWGSKHPGFESYSGFPVVQCEYYRTHEKS